MKNILVTFTKIFLFKCNYIYYFCKQKKLDYKISDELSIKAYKKYLENFN